jgi:N-acyl-D-aspartate/D-glutamate deacylase
LNDFVKSSLIWTTFFSVFDPATIAGPADFDLPDARPQGIRAVLVNGMPVVENGRYSGAHHGTVLRRQ